MANLFAGLSLNAPVFNTFDSFETSTGFMKTLEMGATSGDCTEIREELKKNPDALGEMLAENSSSIMTFQNSVQQFSSFLVNTVLGNDNAELLDILLEAGLDPNTMVMESAAGYVTSQYKPLIFMAVNKEAEQCVNMLLECGANPNAEAVEVDSSCVGQRQCVSSTPLNCAIEKGNVSIADSLLNTGALSYSDTIYTAYAIADCDSWEMLERIETDVAWDIDEENWFEAMIANAGIEKFLRANEETEIRFGYRFSCEGCITSVYTNIQLMEFLINREYITPRFINKTISEVDGVFGNSALIDSLNRLAEADLLDSIDGNAAQAVRNIVDKSRGFAGYPNAVMVSPPLEKFLRRDIAGGDT
ncbi:MAG: hypothetical protein ACI4KM_01380 [Oscillospiraceae bacterium]